MYKPPYVVLVTKTDTPQKISDYFLERGFTWFGSKTPPKDLNEAAYIRTMVGGGLNYADDTNLLHSSYGPRIHLSDLEESPKLTHLDGFKLPLAISVDKNNFDAIVAKIKASGIKWCCEEPVTYNSWNYVVILDSNWASIKDKKWYLYSHQGSNPQNEYSNLTVITGAKFLAQKPKLTECVIRFGCDKTFKRLQRRLFSYGYEWKPGGKNLISFCGFHQIKVIPETNGFYYVLQWDNNAIPANVFLNEDHTNRV